MVSNTTINGIIQVWEKKPNSANILNAPCIWKWGELEIPVKCVSLKYWTEDTTTRCNKVPNREVLWKNSFWNTLHLVLVKIRLWQWAQKMPKIRKKPPEIDIDIANNWDFLKYYVKCRICYCMDGRVSITLLTIIELGIQNCACVGRTVVRQCLKCSKLGAPVTLRSLKVPLNE